MKYREGFVSNSSSSSFILSSKKGQSLKVKMEIDISSLIDNTIETEKELSEYITSEVMDNWGYKTLEAMYIDEPLLKVRHEKMSQLIKDGNVI